MSTEEEKAIDAGLNAIRAEYHKSIRACAEGIRADFASEKPDDPTDWLETRLHETADGSYWVIYTHANLRCMIASDNWLEADDNDVEMPRDGLTGLLPIYAYYAVMADLREYVGDLADESETNDD